MSLAVVLSRATIGINAPLVRVETHLSSGLPAFNIVGLPEAAVKESKERVRSAILNSRLEFPASRITVNLAPADIPKSGGRFDLAIAVGILLASGQLRRNQQQQHSLNEKIANLEFLGELALTGELGMVRGFLPAAMATCRAGRELIIPVQNKEEAGLLSESRIMTCHHLLELCAFLAGEKSLEYVQPLEPVEKTRSHNFDDIVGQFQARRALMIAAAGRHNVLMKGPPGTGKTMLASRLCSILPPLRRDKSLEVAAIRSVSGQQINASQMLAPPFRSPHHTSTAVAMVGGGSKLNVGEISLAHNGVLFLDELPEFSPKVLEVLREPMESGCIQIARASYQVSLPARFQLIAAMNPCPCGYYGDSERECRCPVEKVRAYQYRVSGPLLDRIDIHLEVNRLSEHERQQLFSYTGSSGSEKTDNTSGLDASAVSEQVEACMVIQQDRCGKFNADLDQSEIRQYCQLGKKHKELLETAMTKLKLSTRAYFRIIKIARTIADLAASETILLPHLGEAIQYRKFDRS